MPRGKGFWPRLAAASRPSRPWLQIKVPASVARFLLAAGARPGPNLRSTDLVDGYAGTTSQRQPQAPSRAVAPGYRLPRLDRAAWRMARGPSDKSDSEEGFIEDLGLRWAQRDAGQERLDIFVESVSPVAPDAVVAVTLVTPSDSGGQREVDYLMVFMRDQADLPVAALRVPAFSESPFVFIKAVRSGASLGGPDIEILKRSVSATPDQWARAWRALAEAREPGNTVREVIESAL